jgi:Ca-activated chloride channel family protein
MRLALAFVLLAAACTAQGGENMLLVLDASGSMRGKIEGRTKVEIARATVASVVHGWNPDNQLGLVAYGHRRKGDCADIETLIPVGPLDAEAYLSTVDGLGALGMTPLSAAVRQAAQALDWSEQKATVILVSDGEETCGLDPCAIGAELEKSGVDFTAHVIGFDVADAAHQAQLRCLAQATGGRYFNARDGRELSAALQGAVVASTEPPAPPAQAALSVQQPAAIAQLLTVRWTGPADDGDFIALARPEQQDGDYLTYSRMVESGARSGSVTLATPATAGAYEVRYVNPRRGDAVLARAPVAVQDATASLQAPDTVSAGSRLRVIARGPYGRNHWVGFAPVGSPPGTYLDYARLSGPVSEVELIPPAEPGPYELRYVLNESERVIASRPIEVLPSEVVVSGPASVMAGDAYRFEAKGPVDPRHWIGFAAAGSGPGDYRDYTRPTASPTTGVLSAPVEPGSYELRYVLNEGERVAASRQVTVTPATATLVPDSTPQAGQPLRVAFTGPRGSGIWIGFVRAGTLDYLSYASVQTDGEAVVEVNAPAEPGRYELVFVVGETPIARQVISVSAALDGGGDSKL